MTMLVTIDQAKLHLRIDNADEDDDITLKIKAASGLVLKYLKIESMDALAIGSPAEVPDAVTDIVTAAVLLLIGYLYRLRDDNDNSAYRASFEMGSLPLPVTALLYTLRDPTFA